MHSVSDNCNSYEYYFLSDYMDDKDKLLKNELMQKYLDNGLESMSETEILELVLAFSEKKNIADTAEKLLECYGSINNISKTDIKSLVESKRITVHGAVIIKLIASMSRVYNMDKANINRIDCTETAFEFLKNYYIGVSEERMSVIALENDFNIKDCCFISSGTTTSVEVSCRNILKFLLNNGVDMLIMAHNHPSGSSRPSETDIITTQKIIKTFSDIGIVLIDHIVLGNNEYFSMRENLSDTLFKNVPDNGYTYNKDIS